MSGVATAVVAAGVVAAGASIYSAERQSSATKKAAKMQADTAKQQYQQQEQQFNRQNQQGVDVESLLTANSAMESGGLGSTMLTGAQGVQKEQMNLGKSALLGG